MPILLAAATASTPGHSKQKLEIDPLGTYVLVEIRNVANAGLGGTPIRGSMTIARFDTEQGKMRMDLAPPASSNLRNSDMLRVSLGQKPVVKGKTSAIFLAKIEPDAWVIESSGSTSFSLGSMTFVAKPGEVIDLGVIDPEQDFAEGESAPNLNAGTVMKAIVLGGIFMRRPSVQRPLKLAMRSRTATDLALPEELTGRTITIPQFSYGATFPNHLGGLVNRIDGRAGRNRPAAEAPAPEAEKRALDAD